MNLRSLLLLLTVACAGFACVTRSALNQRAAVREIEAVGGEIYYDYEYESDMGFKDGEFIDNRQRVEGRASWIRSVVGRDFTSRVIRVDLPFDESFDLKHLLKIPRLRELSVFGTQVPDLRPISELRSLRVLVLELSEDSPPIPSLANLSRLHSLAISGPIRTLPVFSHSNELQVLSIFETEIESLQHIDALGGLLVLSISRSPITDIGPVSQLAHLRSLQLDDLPITDTKGIESLSSIESLRVSNIEIDSLEFISKLRHLKRLYLHNLPAQDLTPLKSAVTLEVLEADGMAFRRPPH